ncbi:VWA domain-containing protein [Methanolobus profundi]|uniref:von Willebrand factor type A domain-containing protein n=1 Tax=Methanolobus profundi TaxID=487685 RepID=A0A1I4SSG5_9EURY|nr:VWA domain-containing protein [Methanolobus profundi]SFM67345.1 von Willebrand factor type A domain-containing protein [Methanolobus profundi]
MSILKTILYAIAVLCLLSSTAFALDVEILTKDQQSNAGTPVNLSVQVTYAGNGTPVNNALVDLTTDMELSGPYSAFSDLSGIAEFSLNSTQAGTSEINISVDGGYDLTNITFIPLEIASLLAETDNSVNEAGNITNISFYPVDIFGNINSSEDVLLTVLINDTFGAIVNSTSLSVPVGSISLLDVNISTLSVSSTSGPSNRAILSINSTVAGDILVSSAVSSVSNSSSVQIVPGAPKRMSIYSNDEYSVDTSAAFYLYVYDKYSNPVENADINFSVTPPENNDQNSPITYNSAYVSASSGSTNASGYFYNVFRTDKRAGVNTITISVVNSSLEYDLTITGIAGEAEQFFMIHSPENALANYLDIYTVSACPVDQFINPIVPLTTTVNEMVRFITDSETYLVPLDSRGRANIEVGPTPYVESVPISATYRNASGYTSLVNSTVVNFTADILDSMDVYAVPTAVLDQTISGNHNSTITVVALDQWGHPLPDVDITLNNTNTTVGTLLADANSSVDHITLTTNSIGRVYATFTGNVSGNAHITATSSDMNTSINVSVRDEPFMSISLEVDPPSIETGAIVNVTTVISIEGDLPLTRPAASAMLVLDRSGSMDPDSYAGDPIDVVLVLDRSGSMHGQAMYDSKSASKTFAKNLVSNSRIGVVSFAWTPADISRTDMDLTLLNTSESFLIFNSSIDKIDAIGGTAMGEGMSDGIDLLINDGRTGSSKAMIVLTDGLTNQGNDQQGTNTVSLAKANDIPIYTIGLGDQIDESLLRSIAQETGGKYYSAPDSSDLVEIYNTIAQDISDYDVTEIVYGEEGFTPYPYTFSDTITIQDTYTLEIEGYDFDDVIYAAPYFGGDGAGENLIQINTENFVTVPSSSTPANSAIWTGFSYDITNSIHSGENTITFYDYYDYLLGPYYDYYDRELHFAGFEDPNPSGVGNNKIRNVVIRKNGVAIKSLSPETSLSGSGYDLTFDTSLSSDYFEDTFVINESLNDLKVELQWQNDHTDLDLQLISPSGRIYGIGYDETGYYPGNDGTSEYIWIDPLPDVYPDSDDDPVEEGTWTVRVTGMAAEGTGTWDEDFTVSTYIDKKSAAQLSSHAFVSGLNESDGDRAGLALYSYDGGVLTDSQTSYVSGSSSWMGYFSPETDGLYYFNVTWEDPSGMTIALYDGIELLSSSDGTGQCTVSAVLSTGDTYYIEVEKGGTYLEDTQFTIDVSLMEINNIITAYSESGVDRPRYRTWNEHTSQWISELSAKQLSEEPYNIVIEGNPVGSEIIMLTSDSLGNVEAQVKDYTWGFVTTLNSGVLNSNTKRGFDVKYEHLSGDAVAVYIDSGQSSSYPQYRIWDGSSWSSASPVTSTGSRPVEWIELAADPNSDKMFLVTKDDEGTVRGYEWDGSDWGSSNYFTSDADGDYQSFDVVYDNKGRATVVLAEWNIYEETHIDMFPYPHEVSDGYTCKVTIQSYVWDGSTMTKRSIGYYYPYQRSSSTTYDCWVVAEADPNSNDILMALEDDHKVIVGAWTGSSWSAYIVTSHSLNSDHRSIDVAYTSNSGTGILMWGDGTSYPQYRTTSDGITWGMQSSASDIGAATKDIQLESDPASDTLFLLTSDNDNDLNYQIWDGTTWGSATELEDALGDHGSFDLAYYMDSASEGAPLLWSEWTADVVSSFSNDSLSHLESMVDAMTADGLTAIDEGLFSANNELSSVEGNSTIVLMTDGIDNAGHHSLLEEAQKAAANNTVIHTIGFASNEAEVDPILEEIANMTGGTYYFAPNSSVLKDIFAGIALQLTNFSAAGPVLEMHIPDNYAGSLSATTALYVNGSSNSTSGNDTTFVIPIASATGNAEPVINSSTGEKILTWQLPTMSSGDKWGVWYQMQVYGSGYVPVILPTSSITYMDLGSDNITIVLPESGTTSVSGGFASTSVPQLGSFDIVPDEPIILVDDSTEIEITVRDETGNLSLAYVYLYADMGYFDNYQNPINLTVNGVNTIDFHSATAARAHITAYAYNVNNASDILTAKDMIVVRPAGMITIS